MNSQRDIYNTKLKVRLHVLTPIHIGCDEVYEPTSFYIDENKNKLIEFDPFDFVSSLNNRQREEFLRVCSGENLLMIMKFIHKNSLKEKGTEIDITKNLVDHYKNILNLSSFDKKLIINQFKIEKTAYNPLTKIPYIPGSSLKGSIRTAYLSALASDKKISNFKGKADELEMKLLGIENFRERMTKDPFRMIKVSDFFPLGEVKRKIVYAVNRKKEKNNVPTYVEESGVYSILETIQPPTIFEGTIDIIDINVPDKEANIPNPITDKDSFLLSIHKFYDKILNEEIKLLNDKFGIKHMAVSEYNEKYKEKIKKSCFVIRIGRHSGAEAVTIEGNRKIKIKQGKNRSYLTGDHATTIWFASDTPKPKNNNSLTPFGWAMLEVVDA